MLGTIIAGPLVNSMSLTEPLQPNNEHNAIIHRINMVLCILEEGKTDEEDKFY